VSKHARQRLAHDLDRKKGKRPSHDRILIICEGSKTEPNYFAEIRILRRARSAHIRIVPGGYGTEPRQIVEFALDEFLGSREYERVYTVFDRDDHLTYNAALQWVSVLDKKKKSDEGVPVRFFAIPSVPSFEFWLLLHYENTQQLLHRDVVLQKLKKNIQNYEKGAKDTFATTMEFLEQASERAKALRNLFTPWDGNEPYTNVDELVALLMALPVPEI
jgi:hypothetical protein